MANKNSKKQQSVALLKNLTFAPANREDGGETPIIETGRIKYFGALWKKHNSALMLPNLLFLVSLLPLIFVYAFFAIYGVEKMANALYPMDGNYYMASVGFGISTSASLLQAKLNMLKIDYIYYACIAFSLVFMSIGLAGFMHLCVKCVLGDSFVTKRDTYGNNVPRMVVEFFRGIKKYWLQMLLFGLMLFLLVGGIAEGIVFFVSRLWASQAGGGEYVLLILLCIIGLFGAMIMLHLLPSIVLYDIPFVAKLKNSCIFALQFFIQNLLVLAVFSLPIILATTTKGTVGVLFIAALLVFGAPCYGLITANYGQYFAEKIMTPVYQSSQNRGKKASKKK